MTTLLHLEQQKASMLAEISGWSEARLAYRYEGGWSAAEMFDHIVKVEVNILAAAQQGLLSPHRVGLSDRLRTAFLTRVFRSDRQVKTPASARHVLPDSQPVLPRVIERWDGCRIALGLFIDTFPSAQLDQGIFRHPVGGWMNLAEVLNFFSVHMVHHGFQLKRLEVASRGV